MTRMPFAYDPNQHEGGSSFDPVPPGWYTAVITQAEWRENKRSTGGHLWLEFKIDENHHPQQANRLVWDRLNLDNPNKDAVEIANNALADLCEAIGQDAEFDDPQVLLHKPLQVKVTVKPETDIYDAGNEIRGYRSVANATSNIKAGKPVVHNPPTLGQNPPADDTAADDKVPF